MKKSFFSFLLNKVILDIYLIIFFVFSSYCILPGFEQNKTSRCLTKNTMRRRKCKLFLHYKTDKKAPTQTVISTTCVFLPVVLLLATFYKYFLISNVSADLAGLKHLSDNQPIDLYNIILEVLAFYKTLYCFLAYI